MTLEGVLCELRSRVPFSPWEPHPIRAIIGQENAGKKRLMPEIKLASERAIHNRNEEEVIDLLSVVWVDGFDATYSPLFSGLLRADFHQQHEDVVTALEEIKDAATFEILYQTSLRIPDWDEGRSLAKKCIWALKAIGTEDAMQRLSDLSASEDWIIREFARSNLVD